MVEKTLKMKQWEEASKDLGAKDTVYVSETEGGVPVTKAEEITSKNRARLEPLK